MGFEQVNTIKANFDTIYTAPDPRAYFNTLGTLDYDIPRCAAPVFARLLAALRAQRQRRRIRCLDLGCSYGINAALLKYRLSFAQLQERWTGSETGDLDSAACRLADRGFFADAGRDEDLETIGLDAAAPAVRYAVSVGTLDQGFVANLEDSDPSPELTAALARCDLVISTGAVGYLTQATFARLAASFGRPAPWIASFVLRMFDYGTIASAPGLQEMVTEELVGELFHQRRFRDGIEREGILARLRAAGLDATPERESDGYLAQFFLTRPRHEAGTPLAGLLADPAAPRSQKASMARMLASTSSAPACSK